MSDITITISGPRGIGKTTLAKRLFQLLANSEYYIEEVDADKHKVPYIKDMRRPVEPRRRAPRSVTLEVLQYGFEGVEFFEEEEDV